MEINQVTSYHLKWLQPSSFDLNQWLLAQQNKTHSFNSENLWNNNNIAWDIVI